MDTIYLDHNATSPIRPEVADVVDQAYRRFYANPSSQHRPGQDARRALDDARSRLAELLGANLSGPHADRIIFTSGGTEANNLAVFGISAGRDASPGRLVISAIEHASIVGPAETLLERGWQLDCLGVTPDGVIRTADLPRLLLECGDSSPLSGAPQGKSGNELPQSRKDSTRLVSTILANHETGVLQPVAELAAICNQRGIPLHTDAIQAVGKVPVDFRGLGVAAMSIAAHKFQGPLGASALLLRHDTPLTPLFFGGPQEGASRPGTVCVALVLGMVKALELCLRTGTEGSVAFRSAKERDFRGAKGDNPTDIDSPALSDLSAHAARIAALRQRFEAGLAAGMPGTVPIFVAGRQKNGTVPLSPTPGLIINGEAAARLPNTSSVAFPGLDAQVLLMALDIAGVACSVGAACSSGSTELSPTLRAMGLPREVVAGSLRFSLGNTTTEAEIDEAIARILLVCSRLRP